MKYFKIEKSLDPKVVGLPSNHSEEMVRGYDYNAPDSVYNWRNNNLTPNLNSVLVNKNAKITDLIDCVPIGGEGLIISEKLLEVLSWFNIMDHKTSNVSLIQAGIPITGFLFFYFNQCIDDRHIDFSKSEYANIIFDNIKGEYYEVSKANVLSLNDINKPRTGNERRPRLKNLSLKRDFKYDVFCFNYYGQLIVSEAVKDAIIKEQITGLRFEPFLELVRE